MYKNCLFNEWYPVCTGENIFNAYRDFSDVNGIPVMVYLVENGAMVKRKGDGAFWRTASFLSNENNDDVDYEFLLFSDSQEPLATVLFDDLIIVEIRSKLNNFAELYYYKHAVSTMIPERSVTLAPAKARTFTQGEKQNSLN